MKVGIYLRVSTDKQTIENQRLDLETWARARGHEVVMVEVDEAISGAKDRSLRPGLDAILKAAERGRINMIAAWSLDRLHRKAGRAAVMLDDLREIGCDVYLHKQAIDTSTSFGRAMIQIAGVFAELEREQTIDRIQAGMARARAQGKQIGRSTGKDRTAEIRAALARPGATGKGVARELGVRPSKVFEIKRVIDREAHDDPA